MSGVSTYKWDSIKDAVFQRLDRKMRESCLYLDSSLTLMKLSRLTSTNRTYASRAICGKYGSFRNYVNALRVENLLRDMQSGSCFQENAGDPDEYANKYGFKTRRSLDRILVKETGCTYRRIQKRKGRLK